MTVFTLFRETLPEFIGGMATMVVFTGGSWLLRRWKSRVPQGSQEPRDTETEE